MFADSGSSTLLTPAALPFMFAYHGPSACLTRAVPPSMSAYCRPFAFLALATLPSMFTYRCPAACFTLAALPGYRNSKSFGGWGCYCSMICGGGCVDGGGWPFCSCAGSIAFLARPALRPHVRGIHVERTLVVPSYSSTILIELGQSNSASNIRHMLATDRHRAEPVK